MFERTFSAWRGLVGEPEAERATRALSNSGAEERRFWVRRSANLETSIQLPDSPHRDILRATIRDISRGGANLTVDQEIPPGQLLNLDLPHGEGGVYTVLACVVRSKPTPDGHWVVGCAFSRELTDEDLPGFGAGRARPDAADHRRRVRFDCHLHANYHTIGGAGYPTEALQVLNLSVSGVGLVVDEFIDAGVLLNLELRSHDGGAVRTILSCVVHVTAQSERRWALGCNFIRELGEEDVLALI